VEAEVHARVEAVKERWRFRINQQYIAPIFITCILLGAHISERVLESPEKTALAILSAMAAELVLGRLFTGKWPQMASAYITGISVGILVRSPYYWPYILCSLISITSKYVLRVKARHIWNPSNFGIAAMLFLAPAAVASLSIQFGNSIRPMVIIWILGSFIIWRLKRLHICATYVASFLAFAGLRTLILHDTYWTEIAPITGPMYQLFIFFMITDPKTTVKSKTGQVATAFCVAAMECVFRLMQSVHAPYFALFVVGPIANLIEIYWTARKRKSGPSEPPRS